MGRFPWIALLCFVLLLTLALTGCSVTAVDSPTAPEAGVAFQGHVFGGQQPIVGAHVYLFAAGTGGYGGPGIAASTSNASTSLLTSVPGSTTLDTGGGSTNGDYYVTTNSSGAFSITGDYSCSPGAAVYLYALGGNPGSGTNSAGGLLAALGTCPSAGNLLGTDPFIAVNELSTVAAAYALAGFATDATHISSSNTAQARSGIGIASSNAQNMVGISTGVALATTPAGNGTVPQSEINTLGNILAACVNSTGPSSSPCSTLFGNALSLGSTGATPTDTATAAIYIAQNPAASVSNLYALSTASPPFSPALSAAPSDFTIALSFTGGGILGPNSIAVDGGNNVWIVNSNNSVSEFNGATGAAISPSGGYTGNGLTNPFSIAIDNSGNAWVLNVYTATPPSSVSIFTPSGGVFSGSPFNGGGLSNQNSFNALSPRDIAFDANGNAWVANLSGTATKLNGLTGAAVSPSSGYPIGTSTNSESGVAVDGAGHVWVSGFNGNTLYEVNASTGAYIGASTYGFNGMEQPYSIAIDSNNHIWMPNQFDPNSLVGNTVGEFASLTSGNLYSGGGILGPNGVAIDGAGNVWISNEIHYGSAPAPGLTQMSNSGLAISPATGYLATPMFEGADVAVDSSGNVWVPNATQPVTYTGGTNLVEFVGAGVPVVTPIATAVKNGTIGQRP